MGRLSRGLLSLAALLLFTGAESFTAPFDVADPDLTDQIAAYAYKHPISVMTHVHPALARSVILMDDVDYDPTDDLESCAHEYVWASDMYATFEAAQIQAVMAVHHDTGLKSDADSDLAAWKAMVANFVHGFGFLETYPTNPLGYPASSEADGFTDSQVESQWDAAQDADDPGHFLALYGTEFTITGPGDAGCLTAGEVGCGGHKEVWFLTEPSEGCAHNDASPPDDCAGEEPDVYAFMLAQSGVGILGHPTLTGGNATEFTPYNVATDPGGIDATYIKGTELTPANEATVCTETSTRCGYQAALAWDYNFFPASSSSDDHRHHTSFGTGAECRNAQENPATAPRTMCWVDSFTRQGLYDAMIARTCYWLEDGNAEVQFTIEGQRMGIETTIAGNVDYDFFARRLNSTDDWGTWEIIGGQSPQDGTVGSAAVQATGTCESFSRCQAAADFAPGALTWTYLRIENQAGAVVVATAPVTF